MWDLVLDIWTRIEVKTSPNLDIVLRADAQGRLQFSQRRRGSCDYNSERKCLHFLLLLRSYLCGCWLLLYF